MFSSARMFPDDPTSVFPFAKYHGLGNDFIIVNRLRGAPELSPVLVRALCDRHRGIGADNMLTVWPHPSADARMQVQNADGSEAGQCGNGLRCVARFLLDEGLVDANRDVVRVAAGSGVYAIRRLASDRFVASMGRPVYQHDELPQNPGTHGEIEISAGGRRFDASVAHFGNPHVVVFCDESPWQLADRYGALLENHPAFVSRTNVGFARSMEAGFEAVVHERGDGITQACGSGACAIGASAVNRGLWKPEVPMDVSLPGGVLRVTVLASGEIELEGEAVRVFRGEVSLP